MSTPIAHDDLHRLRIVGLATAPLTATDHLRAARASLIQARDSLQAAANLHGRQGLAVGFDHELAILKTRALVVTTADLLEAERGGRDAG